jgi:hypothetical protein
MEPSAMIIVPCPHASNLCIPPWYRAPLGKINKLLYFNPPIIIHFI